MDLTGIPLSPELQGPVAAARDRMDQPVADDAPGVRDMVRYYHLSHAINALEPDAAVDSLLSLWEADPTNFLWIDLGLRRASILRRDPRLEQILALPVLTDTTTAVGAFRMGRDHYRQESGGRWWGRSQALQAALTPLQRIWLQKLLTMVDRGALRPEDGVRRLLPLLLEARAVGGPRLEFELWLIITNCLVTGDYLDDALHTVTLAAGLAARLDDAYLQTRSEYWMGRVFMAREELEAAGAHFMAARTLAETHDFNYQRKAIGFRAASVMDALGDYPAVLAVDRANLALMRATRDSVNIPRFLINIANTHRRMGQLDSCLVYQDEAVRCVELYPHPSNVARIPLMVAEYWAQVGAYARVDSLLQTALKNPVNTRVAEEAVRLHVNLIRDGLEQGRPDLVYRSIVQVDSLRSLRPTGGGEIRVDHAADLLIAEFYAQQAEYARAGVYLNRAEAALGASDGPETRWSVLRVRGLLARERGDLESAVQAFTDAHDLIADVDNPDLQARSRFLLGSALVEDGRFAAARALFPEGGAEEQFGGRFRTKLSSRVFLGVTHARELNHPEAVRVLQSALDMCSPWSPTDLVVRTRLELGRSLMALDTVAEAAAHLHAARNLLDRDGVSHHIRTDVFHGDLRRDLADALISLYVGSPETAPGGVAAPAALEVFQHLVRGEASTGEAVDPSALQPGQMVFFAGGQASWRWTVGAGTLDLRALPTEKDLKQLMTPLLADLTTPGRAVSKSLALDLGAVLFEDAAPVWAPGTVLHLVCDGFLGSLPWAALPLPPSFETQGDGTALQRGPLVHHLNLLYRTDRSARQAPGPPSGRLLAVGANAGGNSRLADLVHAEAEAQAIQSLWTPARADLLLGEQASWPALRNLDLTSYGAVHLASHARIHRGLPEQSYLVLSGARGEQQLTARTVADLQLTADLVYLSSCETAAAADGRAVGDFVQAFIQAGAGAVIASSLAVDDDASRFLAERVYRHWLDGATLPQALQAGQRDLKRANPRWAHPFYWAFFTLYQ